MAAGFVNKSIPRVGAEQCAVNTTQQGRPPARPERTKPAVSCESPVPNNQDAAVRAAAHDINPAVLKRRMNMTRVGSFEKALHKAVQPGSPEQEGISAAKEEAGLLAAITQDLNAIAPGCAAWKQTSEKSWDSRDDGDSRWIYPNFELSIAAKCIPSISKAVELESALRDALAELPPIDKGSGDYDTRQRLVDALESVQAWQADFYRRGHSIDSTWKLPETHPNEGLRRRAKPQR